MKLAQFVFLAALFSGVCAHASDSAAIHSLRALQQQQLNMRHFKVHVLNGSTLPPATPIRQAQMEVKIMKTEYVQNSNGYYDPVITDVCTIHVPINVYDERTGDGDVPDSDMDMAQCPATIENQGVTVKIGGYIVLTYGELIDQGFEDFKVALPSIYVEAQNPTTPIDLSKMALTPAVATRNLNERSLIVFDYPDDFVNCSSDQSGTTTCTTAGPHFSAVFDIRD